LDLQVHQVMMVVQAHQVFLDTMVLQVMQVQKDLQDSPGLVDHKDPLESMVLMERQANQVNQVNQVFQANQVRLEFTVQLVNKVLGAELVKKVQLEKLVTSETQVSWETQVNEERTDIPARKESQDGQETEARQAKMEKLEMMEKLVPLVFRVMWEKLAKLASSELQENMDLPERWVKQVPKVISVNQVKLEILVLQASKDLKVHLLLDHKENMGQVVTPVRKVERATQASQAKRVTQEQSEHLGRLVPQVELDQPGILA
jgi:hypothetical protein